MNRSLIALVCGFLAVGIVSGRAAKAPLSPEKLKEQASHIFGGEVISVSSKDQKSKIETGIGSHVDRIFTIKLKVKSVAKGAGVKAGEEIVLEAWKPVRRLPREPGLQGHDSIPAAGDSVTVYVQKASDEKVFKPLLPNGIVILKPEKTKQAAPEKKALTKDRGCRGFAC